MPRTLSLYDLDAALAELEQALLDAGGELDDALDARYEALLDAREDKLEAYIALIRNFEASAEAYDAEIRRLQACQKALATSGRRLKDRLLASLQRQGVTEATTRLGRLRVLQASRRAVVLRDEDVERLPERFRRVTVAADLAALREALDQDDPEATAVAVFAEPTPYVRIY